MRVDAGLDNMIYFSVFLWHKRGVWKVEILRGIDFGAIIIQFVVLIFSLSIHEASHAWMADRLGDHTARRLGRVTLNPIPHMDLIGTVIFPILQFFTKLPLIGWAKPVPIVSAHLKNPRRDQIFISLAGPGANLVAGFSAFIVLAGMKVFYPRAEGFIINVIGSMSIPGQKSILAPIVGILFFALIINCALALFNLIPIPPLDGHWMLYGMLSDNAARILERANSYGFLILYALMFTGAFQFLFVPIEWILALLIRL
jgi:Zn-dependent protease